MSTYHMKDMSVSNFPDYPNHRVIFKGNVSRYNANLRGFAGGIGNNRVTDGNGIIIDDNRHDQSETPQPFSGRTLLVDNICYGNGGRGINVFSSDHVDVFNNTLFDNAQTTRISNPAYEVAISDESSIGFLMVVERFHKPQTYWVLQCHMRPLRCANCGNWGKSSVMMVLQFVAQCID